jgi:site-specific DNA recombinase
MSAEPKAVIRCAIYTRKSSEEGLEQSFNSLDAQRGLRISGVGNRSGGASYSRGALYKILQNRMYLGEIHHRKQFYAGEHDAIVAQELWDRVETWMRGSNQGRRDGVRANSSNLLVGLLRDADGNRFTASHTLKNGKRYRYYVCSGTTDRTESKAIRLPAHDVEKLVSLRLQSFLQSNQQVMDELSHTGDALVLTQRLVIAATKRSAEWLSGSAAFVNDFVKQVVRRVVVHPDRMEVEIAKQELRAALTESAIHSTCGILTGEQKEVSDEVIRLDIEARLRRCGGEMRLIAPPDSAGQALLRPSSPLLKAMARGRFFSGGQTRSPVSTTPSGECDAITNR